MITLLLKASFTLVILWIFYKVFLERESFFAINRFYLIASLVLVFVLPFISIPTVVEEQGIISTTIEQFAGEEGIISNDEAPFSNEIATEAVQENRPDRVENSLVKESVQPNTKGLVYWLLWIYFFGVGVTALHLITQLVSIAIKILRSTDIIEDLDCKIVCSSKVKEPCSFFNYIFINPESYDFETYEQILAHERIHVKKKHSLDLLFVEIAIILLWFNPLTWIYRKDIERNIEYQTDDLLLHGEPTEREEYQLNLLKIATNNRPLTVTTNYNQSLIKQRILKMNSKKSNPHSYWKYAFILPMLFVTLVALNKPNDAYAHLNKKEKVFINDVLSSSPDIATISDPEIDLESTPRVDIDSRIAGNPKLDTNTMLPADCDELEKIAKTGNEQKVREILVEYDLTCLARSNSTQINNIKVIKLLVKAGAEIIISEGTGNIEVIGKILKFHNRETYESVEFISHFKHDELNQAIAQSNEIGAMEMISNLKNEHLYEQDDETLANVDLMKKLLSDGAELSFSQISFHMIHDESIFKNRDYEGYHPRNDGPEDLECRKLVKAVLSDDINKIKGLLNSIDVNCYDQNPGYDLLKIGSFKTYNEKPKTAFEAAARVGNVEVGELLLKEGADLISNTRGYTSPLVIAARFGNLEFAKFLISKGVEVNDGKSDQGTPLIAAAQRGQLEMVKFLISQRAEVDYMTANQGTALIAASSNGHLEVVKYLLSNGAKVNTMTSNQGTALIAAANNGHTATVEFLIERRAYVNGVTTNQGTALIAAANNGHTETIKLLLKNGAEINQSTSNQGTALISAANNGHTATVKFLLSNGAEVNQSTSNQGTALIGAANNGHTATVKFLLSNGAEVNQSTSNQGTALIGAANNGHTATVKFLLSNGAEVNQSTSNQGTALIGAANNGHMATVKFLLSNGAEVNQSTSNQGTALIGAASNGHLQTVQFLIGNGAEIDQVSPNHGTALGSAVDNENYQVVKFLLENGANPILHAQYHQDPLSLAKENGDDRMVKLLKKYVKEDQL